MKKNLGLLLTIAGIMAILPGCSYMRMAGPCYGNGCPGLTSGAQPKVAAAQTAPGTNAAPQATAAADANTPAPPQSADAAQPAAAQPAASQPSAGQQEAEQPKPGRFTRMLIALHLHSQS